MRIAVFLICSILITTNKAYNFVCKPGWEDQHSDYCYKKFLTLSRNWNDARSICRSHGGFLVGIRDQQKQYHIQRLAQGFGDLWTGGNDIRAEDYWYWDEGDDLSLWKNWDKGEPNNLENKEDCLELVSEHSWKWNDCSCSLVRPFICELHACHLPDHCIITNCTNTNDYRCTKCQDQGATAEHSLYWPTPDMKACEATCSWKENWCWPGTCADHLAKNCTCSNDFHKSSSNSARCQLSKKADIDTCQLGAESDKGEVGNSTSNGDCAKEESTFINFQPNSLSYTFVMSFETPKNIPNKPIHIHESHFGVVHAEVRLYKEDLNKLKTSLKTESLTNTPKCLTTFGDLDPKADTPIECKSVLLNQTTWLMQDGERLCLTYKAQSGGFMEYKDFNNKVYPAITYTRVSEEKDVCVAYDSSPPIHCGITMSCPGIEPIIIVQGRLTTDPNITIKLQGWKDPFPNRPEQASGIRSYAISIHEMKELNNLTLIMDEKGHSYNVSHNEINITLPRQPALYGIALEVLDHAGNVKSARRFVMYDNSSQIRINAAKHLKVDSASQETNFTWQTHRRISCISWKSRYYNSYNYKFNLLRKIKKDYHGVYQGVYEQESGILPVAGTTNVYGIISFSYSWYKGESERLTGDLIPNFPAQSFCQDFGVRDGETHTVTITSKDIMNHTLSENITFHVDASVPDIEDIWLTKDGKRQLFVHNSTDLAKLVLEFKAFDSHSGLYSIEYFLGTSIGGNELAYKSLAVQTLENKTCASLLNCYCPSIGFCEKNLYEVYFNHLIGNRTNNGQHNRDYHLTIKVTNAARLVSIQHIDILTDDSPPVKGVVVEGPEEYPDIDYTNEASVLVRWNGFIDHESGVMKYRIGIHDHCLTADEMNIYLHNIHQNLSLHESSDQTFKFDLPHEGRYYFSVIAYNNALEPSEVACSDGIVRDSTPATVSDLILESAKARPIIGCYEGRAWHIFENLTAFELQNTMNCLELCNTSITMSLIQYLPKRYRYSNHSSYSTAMCSKLARFTEDWYIYLPSDKIKFTWDLEEQESQIQNVHFGFGSTFSTMKMPDIISYEETMKFNEYHNVHSGLDPGMPIFAFIQVRNKADLTTIVPFGPVIIDETPPLYRGKVVVFQELEDVFVVWNDSAFVDAEQKDPIDSMLFRIGNCHEFKTPYLEAKVEKRCPRNFGTCFKYPLNRIHKLHSAEGSKLCFHLYVYNLAGHFVEVQTDSFILPSRFPPSTGTIIEVDPEHISSGLDIDFIFQSDKVCFDWKGLWHIENVSIAIGIGSTKEKMDVLSFQNITEDKKCSFNLTLVPFKKYYSFARATLTNGVQSVIVSDGFTFIDSDETLNAIHVHSGIPCWSNVVHISAQKTNASGLFAVESKLNDTQIYTIFPRNISLTSEDVIWLDRQKQQFVPIVQQPMFKTENKSLFDKISILPCQEGKHHQASKHVFNVFWTVDSDKKELITHFEVGLHEINNDGSETVVETLKHVGKHLQLNLNHLNLASNAAYRASVKPCFQKMCLTGKMSETVIIENALSSESNIEASISVRNGHDQDVHINVAFHAFQCGLTGTALGYVGAVFNAINPHNQITPWLLLSTNVTTSANIKVPLNLPVYGYKSMEFCVKGICRSGQSALSCSRLSLASNPNEYADKILYEINADSENYEAIAALTNSKHIGEKLRLVHDAEVDFTVPGRRVYGVINGMNGQTTTWFLRTNTSWSQLACSADKYCLQSTTSTDGIGKLNTEHLAARKYFICASFENVSEHVPQLKNEFLCGNGFVVDDAVPKGGRVEIISENQEFITNKDEMEIHWSGFHDNAIDVKELGLEKYEICLGSSPGAQDIVKLRNVGLQNSVILYNLSLNNGMTYFATVKAFDFAGHDRTVFSPGKTLDITAPEVGKIFVGNPESQTAILSTVDLFVQWEGFVDEESGVKEIFLGVGSTNESTDILEFFSVDGEYAAIREATSLSDGYQYFIILKIVNHAGLHALAASEPFMFDRSPPQYGFVYDGLTEDIDYQNETRKYNCYWLGFVDPHTDVEYFEVGLGTKPFQFDVFPVSNVGLRQNRISNAFVVQGKIFSIQNTRGNKIVSVQSSSGNKIFSVESTRGDILCYVSHDTGVFEPGLKYFATVTACNRGGLCTVESSNGVIMDDSPPVPGLVHVGFSGYHEPFLPYNHSLSASWIGFSDPQSGIDHYEWCLGTTPGACQLFAFENIMLSNRLTRTGMNIPVSTALYFTLRAFNKIGLSVERTSEKFQIDISPPVLIKNASINTETHKVSLRNGTQFDRSLIHIEWEFQDLESSIVKQLISLEVNSNGHVAFETTGLGSQTHLTIVSSNGTILRDGDSYSAKITSCNGAGLCVTATSEKVLIDSTPPILGGFMNPMRWTNTRNETKINLVWYGFVDNESGLREYLIGISKLYSGNELSDGLKTVKHSKSVQQTLSLTLTKKLNSNDIIVLTVIGINNVGLRSAVGKVSVTLVPSNTNNTGGFLAFQRHSCISHYCNNDCTCAVVGKKCMNEMKTVCTEVQNVSDSRLNISVYFGLNSISSEISSSATCLSGFWTDQSPLQSILRYEWSVGEDKETPGYGIFDPKTEDVWHDNGINRDIVYCLPFHKHLHHGQRYKLYVKAWISENEFAIFYSNSLLIDLTPPMLRQGSSVIESTEEDECVKDVDYLDSLKTFKVCWNNVFLEKEGKIVTYEIRGGTKPFGDDFIPRTIIDSSTFYNVNQTMNPGTKYFFTIIARNNLGLETSATSDGISLDKDVPIAGTVYNTGHFRNILYQFSNSTLSASWQGFEDHQSFVKSYEIGVYEDESSALISKVESVSMSNRHTFRNLNLKNNNSYHIKVRARDAIHHASQSVSSYAVKIDTSPPIAVQCKIFDSLHLISFLIEKQKPTIGIQNTVIKGMVSLNKNNIYRFGMNIFQNLQFNTLKLQIGNEVMVVNVRQNADLTSSVEHEFLSIYDGNIDFKFFISSREEILEKNINISVHECKSIGTNTSPLVIRQLNPGLISVCGFLLDPESSIARVLVGAGTTRGGYQVRPLSPFSKFNHGLIETNVPHGSRIYLTTMAINNAGQKSTFTEEIIIDHTPPLITNVKVKIQNSNYLNKSIMNSRSSISNASDVSTEIPLGKTHLLVTWNVSEEESKLLHCYCSAGSWQLSTLRSWQPCLNETYCKISNLTFEHGAKINVSVRCVNTIQLAGEETSGPFTIYQESPKTESASLSFYLDNRYTVFEKQAKVQVQSNLTHVGFTWDGFEDSVEMLSYETRLRKRDITIAPWRSVGFKNSAMRKVPDTRDGDTILLEVRAVNSGGYKSRVINASMVLDNRPPRLTGMSASYHAGTDSYSIKWPSVFSPSRYGSTIYQISAGSSVDSSDILSPVSTVAEEILLDWTPDRNQHEMFVHILAFAPNGEFSRYKTKFFVG